MKTLETRPVGYLSPAIEALFTLADESFAASMNMDADGRHEAYSIDANEFEW